MSTRPGDEDLVALSALAEVNPRKGAGGLAPEGHISFIPMADVSESGEWATRQIRRVGDVASGFTSFVEGDVLFAKITPCMENGKGCHAVGLVNGLGFGSTEFHVLRANERADGRFIFHWSQSSLTRKKAEAFMIGSAGQQRVQAKFFDHLYVPALPLPEQRRIAEILDTLDEAIRKTEQVIAKLQQMKQGLLHDLLTRGIDEHGELRDPERHPEQFKDSVLGRIPRGWGVESVHRLLADVDPAMRSGPFGSALLKDELVSQGVPLLGIDNVHVERFVRQFTRFVTPQKAAELSRYRVRPRDVMITIMGTVGRCALVPDDLGEALSSKHIWTLTFDPTRYSPHLVCLQFNHAPWVLTHFGRDEQGGIMSAIRSETLRTALLPVPPLQEQHEIESVLADLDRRLAGEHRDAIKLRTLKHGLMDDLLTGRVRVAVPEEGASP